MAHTNDVIFTEQGLAEFIQQIRQNPEMVCQVRAATEEEIARYNETHPTLAEGRIPGKGITIIQANGDKFSVAVGSDVKAPNFDVEIKNNILFGNGTVTFIVDESYINIPVKGIVNVIDEDNDEIPNSFAVKDFVNEQFENFREELDGILNGDLGQEGYGFIPGYYTSVNKTLDSTQQSTLNNNLKTLEIASQDGVYSSSSGVVFSNNIIAKPSELLTLINNKKVELQNSDVLQKYDSLLKKQKQLEQEKTNLENTNTDLRSERELKQSLINNLNSLIDQNIQKQEIMNAQKDTLLTEIGLDTAITEDELSTQITLQNAELINLNIFNLESEINIDNVNSKISDYEESSDEYLALVKWIKLYEVQQKINNIKDLQSQKEQHEAEKKIEEEQINLIEANIATNTNNITNLEQEIKTLQEQIDNFSNDVNTINNKINTIIPETIVLVDAGANRTWTVIKTQSTSNHEIASIRADKVYGAVYNDYAEYRNTVIANPGHVVIENGDGSLSLATERLQLGANIISDTYGFAIGKTANAQTPIAVCGRVLAYPYEERNLFTPGAAVCSGPNGTVSLMTREEIREWPDAIIGYVSEIPNYEYWGTDNIKVDGRLWIKLA